MSTMPTDYKIPEGPTSNVMDAAFLRTLLDLKAEPGEEPPEFPLSVRMAHYEMARALSLLGVLRPTGMEPTQLATIVALHELIESIPKTVTCSEEEDEKSDYSFMPEIESGRAKIGQKVVVRWRKKFYPVHLLGVEEDRVVVLDDGTKRKFRPDLVRYAEEGEFPDVAENINN